MRTQKCGCPKIRRAGGTSARGGGHSIFTMSSTHKKQASSTTDYDSVSFYDDAESVDSTVPNQYNVRRAFSKALPACPLQPPPNLKTYNEIRSVRKVRSNVRANVSSKYSASLSAVSISTVTSTDSISFAQHQSDLEGELPLEFDKRDYASKCDPRYLIYSTRELDDMKRIVLLLLEHSPHSFALLFNTPNALSTSRGILGMTAATQTTNLFIQKIMTLEFEENANTPRFMLPECPTNLLCQALFQGTIPAPLTERYKAFFAEFLATTDILETDFIYVEDEATIPRNYEALFTSRSSTRSSRSRSARTASPHARTRSRSRSSGASAS